MQTMTAGPRKSDKYIPWYFVGFFLVLFILDGIFVYLATSSHTGVVETSTYQRGLNYNETVAAAEAQAALGWTSETRFKKEAGLTFALKDAGGNDIADAVVKAQFFRPTQEGHDFMLDLKPMHDGSYHTPVEAVSGQWDVRIFVSWKQQRYQTTERIIVPKQ